MTGPGGDRALGMIRDEVRALQAYHVPAPQRWIKLDAMENPYGLPPEVREAVAHALAGAALNRYPDAGAAALKERLREVMGLPADCGLLLGNGSDEIIQIIDMAVARPGAVVLGVEPAFVMFSMVATFTGLAYVGVPLRADFSLDLPALLAAIAQHQPAVIYLASPNNPTGNCFAPGDLAAVIAAAPGLVVVDEAYFPFTDETFLPLLGRQDHVLLMRTVSKMGLAGVRLGLLAGAPRLIGELEKLRLPYNLSVLDQAAAFAVLGHGDVLRAQAQAIRGERERLRQRLGAMPGVVCHPSEANFLTLRIPGAAAVFDALRQRGILVKDLTRAHTLLADALRVTVGTPEENDQFLAALQQIL